MAKPIDQGERAILRTLRAAARPHPRIRIGIGDDAAVLTPRPGEELVLTTDFSIEDRHFRLASHPPEAIGHKCLARGLSDIAAMGARPVAAFVSLAVPHKLTVAPSSSRNAKSWLTRFYHGLLALAGREHVALAGGDLAESPTLAFADIVVIGALPRRRALLRSTAQPGDLLYVTGSLGGAAAELAQLDQHLGSARRLIADPHLQHPHFFPQPRLALGQFLSGTRPRSPRPPATACIDISDGLSTDLLHLCEESSLSAEVDAASIPVAPGATLEQALHGGDDYELLFTASASTRLPATLAGIPIHLIGRMFLQKTGRPRAVLVSTHNRRSVLQPFGWQHF